MSISAERAHLLEEHVGRHFAAHGYVVHRNARLHGRSGGRHEVDVLAEKSDALTTFRVAVECKAWESPIEKDAVSKLSYVLTDLGLNKGIIVALNGWRTGAEQAALELGIDLWGPVELDQLLGRAVARELEVGEPSRLARGYRFAADEQRALARARLEGKGRLGIRTLERLAWFGRVWIPAYLVELSVTSVEVRRRNERLVTASVMNRYEAVSGAFLGRAPAAGAEVVDVDLAEGAIKPRIRDTRMTSEIRQTFERWNDVQQGAAKLRHTEALEALGVEARCRSLTVEDCSLVYTPAYVGWLCGAAHERIVAISGTTGAPSELLSGVLTSHIGHVRASLSEQLDEPPN
jgi:hypothetical protein